MANFNINDLDLVSVLNDADLFEVEQGGVNRKATGAQIKAFFSSSLPTDIIRHKGNCDLSTNFFPGGALVKKYSRFYNTANSTTLTDESGSLIPSKVFVEARQDAPSTTNAAHWFIYYTI